MKSGLAAGLALCAALAGCGSEAADALEETTAKLGEIRSGELSLKVAVEPDTEESAIGFELDGPFALPRRTGELPRADMRYTQIAGPNRGAVKFISSPREAWVEVEGQAYELPPEQAQRLEAGGGKAGGPLAELDVASWTEDAKLAGASQLDGVATERVTGRVDMAKAINDVVAVLEDAGGSGAVEGLSRLEGDEAEGVNRALRSSSLEVVTGRDDRLLRRLRLALDFKVEPRELRGGLGRLSGAKVTLDLRIVDPNGRVRIEEPSEALPYEQHPRG